MRWPLVVLAVPATLLGLVGLPSDWLPVWLAPVPVTTGQDVAQVELHLGLVTSGLSLVLALAGAAAVWRVWSVPPAAG